MKKKDWNIFITAVFFVLGFSFVFALMGVLLETILRTAAYEIQTWLSRIGGVMIILFGLVIIGVLRIPFFEKDHQIHPKVKFSSSHATAFIFGASFAVGWTPCIGPILGAIFTLAIASPSSSFLLLLTYALGMGLPFLLIGLFTNEAQRFIKRSEKFLNPINKIFGGVLVLIGILIFTSQLGLLANFSFAESLIIDIGGGTCCINGSLSFGISFLAGIVSFLSPCVFPLMPAFLAYLAGLAVKKN